MLEQTDEDGIKYPVAYFSKKLNKCQKNYSTMEKEALALILALQHFEVYLSNGNRLVEVWTDHNPLVFISMFKNKNQRLLRWSLFLQEWNLMVKHVRGTKNVLLDILSRRNYFFPINFHPLHSRTHSFHFIIYVGGGISNVRFCIYI